MATRILKFRTVNKNSFDMIRSGKKRVETRAATEKYTKIKAGDTLKFVCGKNSFERKVKTVKIFKTIPAMLRTYAVKDINPTIRGEKELRTM